MPKSPVPSPPSEGLIDAPSDAKGSAASAPASRGDTRAVDVIAFSNALPAVVAAALTLVASAALGAAQGERWAALAASGAFVVYGLDRLRDTTRDRITSPLRTNFTERHNRVLWGAVAASSVALAALLFFAPARVTLLCLAVGAIGLLHRRLKGFAALKAGYVSAAWVAICVGIPALSIEFDSRSAWIAGIFFAPLTANLVASNLRDDETQLLGERPGSVLGFARAFAIVGIMVAWAAPEALRPLGWIPLFESFALAFFRPSEHYGQLAVDGALAAGALASLFHLGLP